MRIRCNSMWRQAVSRHVEDRKDEVRELTLHVPYVSLAALLTPPCGVEHAMHPITLWWVCTCRTLCQQKFDPSKLKLKICLSEKHFFFKKILFYYYYHYYFVFIFRDGLIRRKQVYKRHWLVTQWRIVALFVSHKTKIKFGHGIGFLCEVQRGLIWVIRQFWVKSTSIQPHMYVPKLLLACRYSSTGGLVLQSWFELQIDLRRQTCKFW